MFETSLASKLKKIFDLHKVTFDQPGEAREQEAAFVEVEKADVKVKDKREIARAEGRLTVFANAEKMPMDYFAKRIELASASDKEGFFFFDIGLSKGRYGNIDERTVGFVYLFNSQYDPNQGLITSIDIAEGDS